MRLPKSVDRAFDSRIPRLFTAIIVLLALAVPSTLLAQYDSSPAYSPESGPVPGHPPLDAVQIEQLVAPIALYPDALVAQILAASTYPSQVVEADRWRQAQMYASPEQVAASADVQPWDPAVKALVAFPEVLSQLDRNVQWTTDLGNAYYNQPQDVLEAVQVMRRRADAAGSLRSTPEEMVRYDYGNIEVAPVNPQVVYVPAYNPWTVYGDPVTPYPGFSLLGAIGGAIGEFFSGSPLRYGLGIAMSAFTQTPWGWLAWGLNWLTQAILFNHSDYYSHSGTVADWGFPHRGLHAYAGRGGFGHLSGYGMRGGEGWRHGGHGEGWGHGEGLGHGGGWGGGEWRSFNHESRMHDGMRENWAGSANRGFESNRGIASNRGFESFRNERGLRSEGGTRGSAENGRGGFRSEGFRSSNFGGSNFRSPRQNSNRSMQAYRSPMGNANLGSFPGRSSESFGSRNFTRSSAKSNSGGHHLFGGHSNNGFGGGHSSFHGGGHAPKSFGGGKGFGGGHSHGGGGHSGGGHGGSKHHR